MSSGGDQLTPRRMRWSTSPTAPQCSIHFSMMGTNDTGAGDGMEHFNSVRAYPSAA
jgi:hypothetical protein